MNPNDNPCPPLATFALVAYKQEQFIREAVEGALSQTYSPLQIILSDDCSPDSTFDIMKSMAREYSGPHEILLNRNSRNLGLIGHVNKVFELAQGEVLVGAAGDDRSTPTRVSELMALFIADPDLYAAGSDFAPIDASPNATPPHSAPNNIIKGPSLIVHDRETAIKGILSALHIPFRGCVAAYRKSVYTTFGPLLEAESYEDVCLIFRALLLGRVKSTNSQLVHHRVDMHMRADRNLSGKALWIAQERINRKNREALIASARALHNDLNTLSSLGHSRVGDLEIGTLAKIECDLVKSFAYFSRWDNAKRRDRVMLLIRELLAHGQIKHLKWSLKHLAWVKGSAR